MGMRHAVNTALGRTVGTERAEAVRRAEGKVRARLIRALDVEGTHAATPAGSPAPAHTAAPAAKRPAAKRAAGKRPKPPGRAKRIELLGRNPEGFLADHGPVGFAKADPPADFPRPDSTRHDVLTALHEVLAPRTYFEIGISDGRSLTRSRSRTIGVDPFYAITAPVRCDAHLFRETSDDFFALPDAFEHFEGVGVDLAFIDGMHLAEYALRDFINTEKQMSPTGVIVLDDMLPRNELEAYRTRRTGPWAGDVYKVHEVLRQYRPDLTIVPINSRPTGSYLVAGVDPTSTVLDDHYDEIEAEITNPDPQHVDTSWLERREAVRAEDLFAIPAWRRLVELREQEPTPGQLEEIWAALRAVPPAPR